MLMASLTVGTVTACLLPTDACGCTPSLPPISVNVRGTLTRASTPVSGVPLRMRIFDGACTNKSDGTPQLPPGNSYDVRGGYGVSDAAGNFSTDVGVLQALAAACVVTYALRVSTLVGVPPDTLAAVGVRSAVRNHLGGRPVDTVTVALRLP